MSSPSGGGGGPPLLLLPGRGAAADAATEGASSVAEEEEDEWRTADNERPPRTELPKHAGEAGACRSVRQAPAATAVPASDLMAGADAGVSVERGGERDGTRRQTALRDLESNIEKG